MSDTPVYRGDMSRMRYDKGCTCHAPRTSADGVVLPCGDRVSGVHLYHISGGQYDQACNEGQDAACEIPAVVCVCVAGDICGVLRGEAGGAGVCDIMSIATVALAQTVIMRMPTWSR